MPRNKLKSHTPQTVLNSQRYLKRARAIKTLMNSIKKHVRSRGITIERFEIAIVGSGGLKHKIAENLGCSYRMVQSFLSRQDDTGEKARTIYQEEVERAADAAEETIQFMIKQRVDYAEAARTSRWYLERKTERGFNERSTLKIEGGSPIQIQQNILSIDSLHLPVELRVQLLESIERQQIATLSQAKELKEKEV